MRKHIILAIVLLVVLAILVGPCVLKTPTENPNTTPPEPEEPAAADSTGTP